jgi:hypothetical protein
VASDSVRLRRAMQREEFAAYCPVTQDEWQDVYKTCHSCMSDKGGELFTSLTPIGVRLMVLSSKEGTARVQFRNGQHGKVYGRQHGLLRALCKQLGLKEETGVWNTNEVRKEAGIIVEKEVKMKQVLYDLRFLDITIKEEDHREYGLKAMGGCAEPYYLQTGTGYMPIKVVKMLKEQNINGIFHTIRVYADNPVNRQVKVRVLARIEAGEEEVTRTRRVVVKQCVGAWLYCDKEEGYTDKELEYEVYKEEDILTREELHRWRYHVGYQEDDEELPF